MHRWNLEYSSRPGLGCFISLLAVSTYNPDDFRLFKVTIDDLRLAQDFPSSQESRLCFQQDASIVCKLTIFHYYILTVSMNLAHHFRICRGLVLCNNMTFCAHSPLLLRCQTVSRIVVFGIPPMWIYVRLRSRTGVFR